MKTDEIKNVLDQHKLWNVGEGGIRANLRHANLRHANLSGANLRDADLSGANLRDANLDFSCWPLWCGSSNVKIDERQARQLMAHALNVAYSFWPGGLTNDQVEWLNGFHRIKSNEFPGF